MKKLRFIPFLVVLTSCAAIPEGVEVAVEVVEEGVELYKEYEDFEEYEKNKK